MPTIKMHCAARVAYTQSRALRKNHFDGGCKRTNHAPRSCCALVSATMLHIADCMWASLSAHALKFFPPDRLPSPVTTHAHPAGKHVSASSNTSMRSLTYAFMCYPVQLPHPTHTPTHPPYRTPPLPASRTKTLTHSLARSPTPPTHPLTDSPTHPPAHPLTHSLTHSLTHPPTHPLTRLDRLQEQQLTHVKMQIHKPALHCIGCSSAWRHKPCSSQHVHGVEVVLELLTPVVSLGIVAREKELVQPPLILAAATLHIAAQQSRCMQRNLQGLGYILSKGAMVEKQGYIQGHSSHSRSTDWHMH